MSELDDLRNQNRILRERIERLEDAPAGKVHPAWRVFVENAPAYLTVVTPDGFLVATGRTSEGFGSVIGRSVYEFTPPDQHQTLREAHARACSTRQPVVYETIGYGENGEPNHAYLVRVVPLIENDVVTGLVVVPLDITERVRLAKSLAESEEKLRFAVSATGMGLWHWDVANNRLTWDQRVRDIYGVTETPDPDSYMDLLHADDRATARNVIETAFATGVCPPFEYRIAPRPNEPIGKERWVLGTATVIRDANGKPTTMLGGVLDITEQKYAAAQLQRAHRVEALGQLTAGLAHNFNNLLVAIIPNLELALLDASASQTGPLTAALNASFQARDLIKRLMSVTGPRAASPSQASDPRETLERVVALCRATFPREIQITYALDPAVGQVAMETVDLDQVMLNLLVNARDVLERTAGRARQLDVNLDTVARPTGRHVRVRVRDNGLGMSPAVRARVFEPFFTTKPAHRGSGLGLADALVRVRTAKGNLDCESVEGEGTTFTLLLPEMAAPPSAPAPIAAPPTETRGETILMVDDEPAVRMVIAHLLRHHGYQVIEADSAAKARAALSSPAGSSVRLILLDQSMPYESGTEALPSLKKLSPAPVVLFTGGMTELPPDAAGVLEKPAVTADLLRMVHDLIHPAKR